MAGRGPKCRGRIDARDPRPSQRQAARQGRRPIRCDAGRGRGSRPGTRADPGHPRRQATRSHRRRRGRQARQPRRPVTDQTAIRLGALCWNQYTEWPALLYAGARPDQLGYDTLWTWDHLYPIQGSSTGPMFEGWLTLAAWAQATERVRIGLMVGANPFREPTLTTKMATTLDHISNGRAILGIGAAWFEEEHEAFGIAFGSDFPERLRWLAEALRVMRGMLHDDGPTAAGPRYTAKAVRN